MRDSQLRETARKAAERRRQEEDHAKAAKGSSLVSSTPARARADRGQEGSISENKGKGRAVSGEDDHSLVLKADFGGKVFEFAETDKR